MVNRAVVVEHQQWGFNMNAVHHQERVWLMVSTIFVILKHVYIYIYINGTIIPQ